jgi:hypothetical protein
MTIALGALLACACGGNGGPPPEPTPPAMGAAPAQPGGAQIANPASVHCEEQGGKLELREEPGGTIGVCVFEDGSRCEEWRFLRGECAPGQCREADGRCPGAS